MSKQEKNKKDFEKKPSNGSKNIKENDKEDEEYNDFQKEEVKGDNIFVTNLPKESIIQNQET